MATSPPRARPLHLHGIDMDQFREHWLVGAARRAGLTGTSALRLHAKAPVDEVWGSVARACRLTEAQLARTVAVQARVNPAELGFVDGRMAGLLPERVARQFRVFPLRTRRNELVVATSDPNDLEAEQVIAFCAGRRVVFELAAPSQIDAAIESAYSSDRLASRFLIAARAELANAIKLAESSEPESVVVHESERAPLVKLTNLILHDAIAAGASDVHIEPELRGGLVRVRIDGVMQSYMTLPRTILVRLVSRLKVMGNMDVSDRVRPHSGRATVDLNGLAYDLRISTVPTRQSEKVVVRLLGPGKSQLLGDLALPERELDRLRELFSYKDGLVVVTGPTGSGKTTTLYAALRELATGKINVMTVEDPVEYEFAGVTQIQVAPRQGLTFASVVRTLLRQDPDVILIGEIRDLETAEIAVQASMTGHLVLTTLHTTDAAGVIPRLAGLGLNRTNIASSLRGVVAQRLVRRVCAECRTAGCDSCRGTGYHGRIPLVEVFLNTPAVAQAITDGVGHQALNGIVRESGLIPMQALASERISAGETTAEEVARVLGKPLEEGQRHAPAETPHVLLVATDPVLRRSVRTLLEQRGCRVAEVTDGLAALERVRGSHDLTFALIDLDMAGMSGRELLSRLKSSVATLALPVLVLTASADGEVASSAMEGGAEDCIAKPIDAATFAQQIDACLRRIGVPIMTDAPMDLDGLLQSAWPSVAVLPFADMSASRDQRYLCEGLAEELIGALSKLDGLRVASRTSSFRTRKPGVDARDLGRQLGVGAVLEGSVQKVGDRLRISTHLVNVDDGYDLWSERYDRTTDDIFDLQAEIVASLVTALRVVLLGEEREPVVALRTSDIEAHDAYLKGRYEWNRRTEDSLVRSVELFKEAGRRDPHYALAHAGLADAYVTLAIYGAVAPTEAMPEAMRAAERARTLDARSAEALSAMGCVRALYVWDWDAEAEFKRAIELDPRNAKAHHWYASNYLMPLARFDDARAELEIARRLDPLSPAIHATSGVLLYYERRFDDAVDALSKTTELDPAFGFAWFFIGQARTQQGRYDDAIAALGVAETLTGGSPEVLAALAYARGAAGDQTGAQLTMDELLRLSGQRYVSPVLLSQGALALGDTDQALDYLGRARELRATDLVWMGVRPVFDSIRSRAAFTEISSQVLSAQS